MTATEKVYGANFVVGVAGEEVRLGRCKAWFARDAAFFGRRLTAAELEMPYGDRPIVKRPDADDRRLRPRARRSDATNGTFVHT